MTQEKQDYSACDGRRRMEEHSSRGVRMGITMGFSWGSRYNEETPPFTLHLGPLKGQVKGHQKLSHTR